ncbi:MAG: YceI family protein [Thermoanaerobaculia bacterium]
MKRFVVSLSFLFAALPLFADTWTIDKNHSEANFRVRHMVSKVSGRFNDFAGVINADPKNASASSVQFAMKTASVDTGNADRDKDLRTANFFEVDKYPEITFKSTSIKPSGKKDVYDVTGDLTMHGVTKRITIPVEFLGSAKDPWGNERAGFTLSTTLNRKDYGINWNKALDNGGVLLGEDVDININIEAVKSKEAAGEKKGQ